MPQRAGDDEARERRGADRVGEERQPAQHDPRSRARPPSTASSSELDERALHVRRVERRRHSSRMLLRISLSRMFGCGGATIRPMATTETARLGGACAQRAARTGHRAGGAREEVLDLLGRAGLLPQRPGDPRPAARRRARRRAGQRLPRARRARAAQLVHRVDVDGTACFEPADPSGEHHHHAICDRCGKLDAFEDPELERLIDGVAERLGYAVGAHDVVLRGACPDCAAPLTSAAAGSVRRCANGPFGRMPCSRPRDRRTASTAARRSALGAAAIAAALLRPRPALAARPALFELALADEARARRGRRGWRTTPRAARAAPLRPDRPALGARRRALEAQVRARRRGGAWTPLGAAARSPATTGPTARARPPAPSPACTGAADEFQLRLRGRARGLRARFVRAQPTARRAARAAPPRARPRRARSQARRRDHPPQRVGRRQRAAARRPRYGEVQLAFVHHTVTANDYAARGVGGHRARHRPLPPRLQRLERHRLQLPRRPVRPGLRGPRGRASTRPSSAPRRRATTASRPASPASARSAESRSRRPAWRRSRSLIGWKLSLHGVPVAGPGHGDLGAAARPTATRAGTPVTFERISGHRDGDSTSCPGDDALRQLPDLRARGRATRARSRADRAQRRRPSSAAGARRTLRRAALRRRLGRDRAPVAVESRPRARRWTRGRRRPSRARRPLDARVGPAAQRLCAGGVRGRRDARAGSRRTRVRVDRPAAALAHARAAHAAPRRAGGDHRHGRSPAARPARDRAARRHALADRHVALRARAARALRSAQEAQGDRPLPRDRDRRPDASASAHLRVR